MARATLLPEVEGFLAALNADGRYAFPTRKGVIIMQRDETRIGGFFKLSEEWAGDAEILGKAMAANMVSLNGQGLIALTGRARAWLEGRD